MTKIKKIQPKALVAILMLLVCIIGAGVFAKYVYKNKGGETVKAEWFYLTSDLLDGETHILKPDTTTISFTVGNHADKLRNSDMDIKCSITVVPNDGVTITYKSIDENDIDITNENGSFTLSKEVNSDVTVTISGLENGETYTVTAQGTDGYHKTLTATLKVQEESVVYKYLDTSDPDYVLLTVWSKGYTGNVEIEYPKDYVIVDNTDSVMRMVENSVGEFTDSSSFYENTENLDKDEYTSHVYRFFGSGVSIGYFNVYYGTDNKQAETKKPE